MSFLIIGSVLAFFGIALLIVGISLQRDIKKTQGRMQPGVAEVVGYQSEHDTHWSSLMVKIPAVSQNELFVCKSGHSATTAEYPKGCQVHVLYTPKKVVGIQVMEVQLRDDPPANTAAIGKIIKTVAQILLVAGAVLVATGIITFII